MKKFIIIFTFSVLAMSLGIVANPVITKHTGTDDSHDKYTGTADSLVFIEYNYLNKSIKMNFKKPSNDVRVYIYKDGDVVFEDADHVQKGTTLNYTIKDSEGGVYDAVVESDGRRFTMDPIWIEE